MLASPEPLPPAALVYGCWGLALGCGALGRMAGLAEAVARLDRSPDMFEAAHYRVAGVGNAWTRALRLAGRLTEAERDARAYVERYADASGGSSRSVACSTAWCCSTEDVPAPLLDAPGRRCQEAGNKHPVWSYVTALEPRPRARGGR